MIEKACAKVWGSYRSVHGGFMNEALQLLTGAPSEQIQLQTSNNDDNDNDNLLWTKLVSACEAKFVDRVFSKLNLSSMNKCLFRWES